ncbi:MAG: hypothetical protein GY835_13970 [bacterium]|nr:hypothetical protein [bacterium]
MRCDLSIIPAGNGRKAQMYLTDQKSVVYILTHRGYDLLMSIADPESVAAKIRRTLGGTNP